MAKSLPISNGDVPYAKAIVADGKVTDVEVVQGSSGYARAPVITFKESERLQTDGFYIVNGQ